MCSGEFARLQEISRVVRREGVRHTAPRALRDRINAVRQRIAAADPRLSFIGRQFGMFSMLPLSKEQVLKLREDEAIYMADSGRFNVVGMSDDQIDRFTAAVVGALEA